MEMPRASDEQLATMFPDIDLSDERPQTQPKPEPVAAKVEQPKPTNGNTDASEQVLDQTVEPQDIEEVVDSQPEQVKESRPVDEVEVSEEEYQYLKKRATETPDDFIAKYISQRKTAGTLQSQRDKLLNAVGKQFAELVYDGQVKPEMQRLFSDLQHPEMQEHLSEFYQSHELKDGKYIRTVAKTPPAAVLSKFVELSTEKATLSARKFMPDGQSEDFDANEALSEPGSVSGRAYAQFMKRSNEIDTEINKIINEASAQTNAAAPNMEEQRRMGQKALEQLSSAHPELKNTDTMTAFTQYVQQNSNNLLEVFHKAFRADSVGKTAVRKLVVREIDAIASNRQSAKTTPDVKALSKGDAVPAHLRDVDPKYREAVAKDADYFGDYK
jgi:hypothetical protein